MREAQRTVGPHAAWGPGGVVGVVWSSIRAAVRYRRNNNTDAGVVIGVERT
jgi:hypothetical protein